MLPIDMRAAIFLVLLSGSQLVAASHPQWIKLTSTNFQMYTSAGEKKGREAILYFEQVRSFFLKALGMKDVPSAQPVRIVAFSSDKEYEPYSANEVAAAYYATDGRRDYIVMRSIAPESYHMAVHEYTHLVLRHSTAQPAIWFNEGLAEVYSTLKPVGKKVQVGDVIPGRVLELRQSKWIDLGTLTSVGQDSPLYNEKKRAGVFYDESWALTHMLVLSQEYTGCRTKAVPLLLENKAAADVFQAACGKSLSSVQKDLVSYVNGSRFFVGIFPIQLEKRAEAPDTAEAAPVESGIVLADVLMVVRKRTEARARFEKLAKEYPKAWEPEAGLAELAWMDRRNDAARRHFARAAELGSTDAQMYMDYASLEPANSALLRKALELRPGWQEAQYRLGLALINEGNYQEAVDDLRRIPRVTPAQAFPYFYGLAYASYRLGQKPAAAKYIEQARQWAKAPGEAERAEELAGFLHGKLPAVSARAAGSPASGMPEGRPHLTRRDEGPEAPDATPAQSRSRRESVQGTLRQVDCNGSTARLTLESAGRLLRFSINDPNHIALRNAGSGPVEFQCGPQKARPVLLEYEAAPDSPDGIAGELRAIEFR